MGAEVVHPWPANWHPEAVQWVLPYFDADVRLQIVVGDHAVLAVDSTTTLTNFLISTYRDRASRGARALGIPTEIDERAKGNG